MICATDVGHFLGGLLVAFLSIQFPVLAVLLTAVFVVYEMDESWHINDEAFNDIKIYLLGAFGGGIVLLCQVFLK